MIKRIIPLIFILFLSEQVFSQEWELGSSFGASKYLGEMTPNVQADNIHPSVALFAKKNWNPYFSWKPSLLFTRISGADSLFEQNKTRNLHFFSNYFELSNNIEFNFFPFGIGAHDKNFTPFVSTGLSIFYFNPRAELGGRKHNLIEHNTEGQNSKNQYKNIQIALPFSFGLKFNLQKNWVVAIAASWRKTYTDHLDDVSGRYPDLQEQEEKFGVLSAKLSDRSVELYPNLQSQKGKFRGDPQTKDWVIFAQASISYRFTPIKCWPVYKTKVKRDYWGR